MTTEARQQPADPRAPLASLADDPGLADRVWRVTAFLESGIETAPVVRTDARATVLDLSVGSRDLGERLAGLSVERFGELVEGALKRRETGFGYGRWGESREFYESELFAGGPEGERRSIHLGVDVFCAGGTPVHVPLDGRVHLKAVNAGELDYGPLLVLRHETPDGTPFYTLYGHLALAGSRHLAQGDRVVAGDRIATVGLPPENGNWPPHLHFQVIVDLLGMGAAFPGVAYPREQHAWLALSPLPAAFFPQCPRGALDGRERAGA